MFDPWYLPSHPIENETKMKTEMKTGASAHLDLHEEVEKDFQP